MNRFAIPRDIYLGENALAALKKLEGTKAALIIGGAVKKNSF
jgi:alcohol dehydrogenase class IV